MQMFGPSVIKVDETVSSHYLVTGGTQNFSLKCRSLDAVLTHCLSSSVELIQ